MECSKAEKLFQYKQNNPRLEYRSFQFRGMPWYPIEPYVFMDQGGHNAANFTKMIWHISGVLKAQGMTEGQLRAFSSTVQEYIGECPDQERIPVCWITYLMFLIVDKVGGYATDAHHVVIRSYAGSGKAHTDFKIYFGEVVCGGPGDDDDGEGLEELDVKNKGIRHVITIPPEPIKPSVGKALKLQ